MKGQGRLLRGLTPPELADEVLGKRIERMAEPVGTTHPAGGALQRELRRTSRLMRTATVIACWEGVLLVILAGLRLAGV